MILLDAYALLAYLRDELAAEEVAALLRTGDCAITAANLAEVLDQLLRRQRLSREEVAEVVSPLLAEVVEVRPVDASHAWSAAEIRARHYRRTGAELSLADCLLIASAAEGDSIASSDPALIAAAQAEGISISALPDSTGRRPPRSPRSKT